MKLESLDMQTDIWGSGILMVSWPDVCEYIGIDADEYKELLWYQRIEDGMCPEGAVHALANLLETQGFKACSARAREISKMMLDGGRQ